jgi:hypothetical protein
MRNACAANAILAVVLSGRRRAQRRCTCAQLSRPPPPRTSPRDRRPGLPCLPDVLAGAPGDTLEGAFKGSESTCQYAA